VPVRKKNPTPRVQNNEMTCSDVRPLLGELLDGELSAETLAAVEAHLAHCGACRAEYAELQELVGGLRRDPRAAAPAELWTAIERRLEAASGAPADPPVRIRLARFVSGRRLATAASLLLAVGLGWLALQGPWAAPAGAAQIDFRPVLEQADGDIQAGIAALLARHGGHAVTPEEAAELMRVRVAAPDELPGGLTLRSLHVLHMGRHHKALAWHYSGPAGQLLILQCPPKIEKRYGNRECVACRLGGHNGHGVQVGKLRLMHSESANLCLCVVTTLGEQDLEAAMEAVKVEF